LAVLVMLACASVAQAQSGTTGEASTTPTGFGQILLAGGPVGLLILLLSIAAMALVIEHLFSIRRDVLIPPGLGERVRQLLPAGKFADARKLCAAQPSLLAFVLSAGLSELEAGWSEMEKAMQEALAEQSARLFRKIEYLSLIGNIAPMLGLLGTVIGMIFAFRQVAETQGAANAGDLAEGIYLALVTTVEGLIVAIPAVAAFAVFRNRVDQLVAEATYAAGHALSPIKRHLSKAGPPAPPKVEG